MKNFYIWHRRLGLMACVFVLAWSLSGFLHPIMSWTQARPVKMAYDQKQLSEINFGITPAEALRRSGVTDFETLKVVSFAGESYYQVEPQKNAPLVYLNTSTGDQLEGGDEKYARHLARHYLGDEQSGIVAVNRLTKFGGLYTRQNRFLPVYEVAFDRSDNMKVYIDTSSSRVATLVNSIKSIIQTIFINVHNFEFAGIGEPYRSLLLVGFMLITFASAASGFLVYLIFWKRFRSKTNGNQRSLLRKYHRTIGIVTALFVLMMSFSGGFHAFEKRTPDERHLFSVSNNFSADVVQTPLTEIVSKAPAGATDLSLVKIGDTPFYRVTEKKSGAVYLNASTGATEANGELKYARSLANAFSGLPDSDIASVEKLTAFSGEYGFINKRLPVAKVQYDVPGNKRYYVETSTAKLGAQIEDNDLYEGYTFSLLHKMGILDFIGNLGKDLVLMTFATLNIIVASLGIWLFAAGNRRFLKMG